jgi:hypothetical protein
VADVAVHLRVDEIAPEANEFVVFTRQIQRDRSDFKPLFNPWIARRVFISPDSGFYCANGDEDGSGRRDTLR